MHLPWLTLIVAAVLALNPVGLDFIRNAFWSGEALSRNIAQPIVLAAAAILVLLALAEIAIRRWRR